MPENMDVFDMPKCSKKEKEQKTQMRIVKMAGSFKDKNNERGEMIL